MNKKAVFMVGRRVIEGLDGRSGGTCSRLRAACSTPAAGEPAAGADGLRPQLSREHVMLQNDT
jgi:hypothetical protein